MGGQGMRRFLVGNVTGGAHRSVDTQQSAASLSRARGGSQTKAAHSTSPSGSGLNLPFYARQAKEIFGLDPPP